MGKPGRPPFGRKREASATAIGEHLRPRNRLRNLVIFFSLPIVAGLLLSLFWWHPTLSQQPTFSQQYDLCEGTKGVTPDLQIAGCTGLIQSGRGNQHGLSEAFYNRGNAYVEKGDFDYAIADYNQTIRFNPTMSEAFDNLGFAYQEKRQYDRAIADYDRAIQLNPNSANALHNRCWARFIIGELSQALSDCNESLRIRPDVAITLKTRGFVYLKNGVLDKAIADFDAALKYDPKIASALYGRGLAKQKQGSTGTNVDIAAAKSINPHIAEEFASYGVK